MPALQRLRARGGNVEAPDDPEPEGLPQDLPGEGRVKRLLRAYGRWLMDVGDEIARFGIRIHYAGRGATRASADQDPPF